MGESCFIPVKLEFIASGLNFGRVCVCEEVGGVKNGSSELLLFECAFRRDEDVEGL